MLPFSLLRAILKHRKGRFLLFLRQSFASYRGKRLGKVPRCCSCDLNHKFAATEGLWFQFMNGKLMVPISVQHIEASLSN